MEKSKQFYAQFPTFNWKFYVALYDDLRQAGINTEYKAIKHYIAYGQKEGRRSRIVVRKSLKVSYFPIPFEDFVTCRQARVSSGLTSFRTRFKSRFGFVDYESKELTTLFFGVYNDLDIEKIYSHQGPRFIMWGGEDSNPNRTQALLTMREVRAINNVVHVAISSCIQNSLMSQGIHSVLVTLNMVDTTLFKYIPKAERGHSIFVYNGLAKGGEHIYGVETYERIVKALPSINFIFSNTLNLPYEQMPEVYQKCFIALRLTGHDGNANTVLECRAMRIPIVHNQSDYGLKWKTYKDVMYHIDLHNHSLS